MGDLPPREARIYKNPIKEALKYKGYLDREEVKTQADLAQKLGISRAKVTQMLNLMSLNDEIKEVILALVVFYRDENRVPVLDWLKELKRKDRQGYAKCIARIRMLAQMGHELRRPLADYLDQGKIKYHVET